LVGHFEKNPLDRTGHSSTRAGIRDVVKTGWGAAAAKALRFVVH
jgi:hypothetical protein